MNEPVVGKYYRHFKGHIYKVISLGKHSETLEDMVIYRRMDVPLESAGEVWVRPVTNWQELKDGLPRFAEILDEDTHRQVCKAEK